MHPPRILLGVNIDHIATLRQARGTRYPDPIQAALLAEEAGADGITVHLREESHHRACARIAAISRSATCACWPRCSTPA